MKSFIFTAWCWSLGETLYIVVNAANYEEAYDKAFDEAFNALYIEEDSLELCIELDTDIRPGVFQDLLPKD